MWRYLASHFAATPKSLAAAVVAVVGILSAYDLVSPEAAVAISTGALPICALLVPRRKDECTTDASDAIADEGDPNARATDEGRP